MNILMVILVSVCAVQYILKLTSLKMFSLIILCAVYIAALSELKIFFVELAFIIIFAILSTKFSIRKLAVIGSGLTGMLIMVNILVKLYPYWNDFFI